MPDTIDRSLLARLKAQSVMNPKLGVPPVALPIRPLPSAPPVIQADAREAAAASLSRSVPKWASNDLEGTRFEIYFTEIVQFTSVLRGGGEWRWRLCTVDKQVLAASAGYTSEAECLAAVEALRRGARSPILRRPH